MPRPLLAASLATLLVTSSPIVRAEDDQVPKGVNPKDNITKVDVIYTHDAFAGDADVDTLALKYDRALGPRWGANFELPVARFDAPFLRESGLGDAQVRLRWVESRGTIDIKGMGARETWYVLRPAA